jgi:quinol monooxygenase YgiN
VSQPDIGRFGLVVRFELIEGHEEDFDVLTAETLASIRSSEPGTLAYVVHHDQASPITRVFYELYQDEAAFDAHESMPHVRRFLSERSQLLIRDPDVWRVTPFDAVVRPEANPSGA